MKHIMIIDDDIYIGNKNCNALNGLTMHVPKGAIYGFVGKNGAGKTTLIRLICGLQEPTSGSYILYGVNNTEKAIHKTRRRINAVVETPSIYLDMTSEDNLKEQYRVLGLPSFDGLIELLKLVGLENTGKKKAKNFSLGMRQRLGIAVALCGDPDFLILDEPVNGLDPYGIIEIRELILKLNREHQITVLISSHILDELSKLATYFGFIDDGVIVKEINAKELEAACRKCIRLIVSDVKSLCCVLDKKGLKYSILSDIEADLYGAINVTELTLALAKMRNLLSANITRLRKNRMFWICALVIFVISILFILNGGKQANLMKQAGHTMTLDDYYFDLLPYIGLLFAAFDSLFLGTEYSDGTIRNKIVVGHLRSSVFISNYIVCLVANMFFLFTWMIGGLVGIPFLGFFIIGVDGLALYIAIAVFSTVALTAILTIICMLSMNKAIMAASSTKKAISIWRP